MLTLGPEVLLRLVDLLIILGALGMLVYIRSVMKMPGNLPSSGRGLILWGIAITVFLHVFEVTSAVFFADRTWLANSSFLSVSTPEWLHWLLSRTALAMVSFGALFAILQRRRVDDAIHASAQKVLAAEDQAMQSEARFRNLIETTSNAVYCYTFDPPMRITLPMEAQIKRSLDAELTECNHVFARELRAETPADVIGTTMAFLDSSKDEAAHAVFFTSFVEAGYRLIDHEFIFQSRDGDDCAVSVNLTGIVQDGALHRIWGVERNILDVQRTKTALDRRRLFQQILAGISSRLVVTPHENSDRAITDSFEEVCGYFGGNRIRITWVDWEARTAEVAYTWIEEGSKDMAAIEPADFPYLTGCLERAEPVRINDVGQPPVGAEQDAATLAKFDIKSFMFLPLVAAGDVVGAVTLAHDGEYKHWGDQDTADLRVIAELFASYVVGLRSRRALDDALTGLQKATERLEAENVYLRHEIQVNHDFEDIIGESDSLRRSLQMVEQVADTMTPVLVLGETGTGKELIAHALHEHSSRRDRPLVKVNCAALPANLIESELFGYEKGAFTSADKSKRGRFDLAHGSSIFLDEIGEIPIELQAKLLRVLQEGEFERLGGTKTVKVDVRLIAATNRDLWRAAEDGEFRSDLLYRISTFPIELPALRDRGDDVQMLAEHFVQIHSHRLGREVTAISADMMRQLRAYNWPGNVRELEGVIQRALISSSGPVLTLGRTLSVRGDAINPDDAGMRGDLRAVERDHIVSVLNEAGWKISGELGAAARLGIPPSTLRSKMKKLEIERPH